MERRHDERGSRFGGDRGTVVCRLSRHSRLLQLQPVRLSLPSRVGHATTHARYQHHLSPLPHRLATRFPSTSALLCGAPNRTPQQRTRLRLRLRVSLCVYLCVCVDSAMDRLAGSFLSNGDVANASSLYNSLEKLNPAKYSRMARICRVLLDPQSVPLPHRHSDICDALLDPLVPPELLLRDSVEDVQKAFQRLAVSVHPDKNPNNGAKDAFLRLTAMKDKALTLLRDGAERKGGGPDGDAQAPGKPPTASGRRGKPKAQGAAHAIPTGAHGRRPPRPAAPPPAAAGAFVPAVHSTATAVSSSIAQLRNTKITLNALKRKDIADDFEIFSATQRTTATRSEVSLSDVEDDHLAATVPVMPSKQLAQRVNRRRPLHSASQEPTAIVHGVASSSSSPLLSSSLCDVRSVPSRTPPSPPPLGSSSPAMSIQSTGAGARDAPAAFTLTPSLSGAASPTAADAIRRQIDETCVRLREMRVQHTTVRFNLDLSFDAYERSKNTQ
ncbi:DnaJ domain containing protein [Novymonas esmeraldas]|uniref:DnaJ domain containing protein n=1 Tax=Novymonas esmeraldas TaxID=1808958 RepID=A0AAW0ER62_9TRYP